jgi:hypothetical protein
MRQCSEVSCTLEGWWAGGRRWGAVHEQIIAREKWCRARLVRHRSPDRPRTPSRGEGPLSTRGAASRHMHSHGLGVGGGLGRGGGVPGLPDVLGQW